MGQLGGGMMSATEIGCRGLLLILPCDLGQDTDFSGNRDSQTPGRVRSAREQ